mmetsp:Transcript_21125/g.72724  ORF Transcript_21125/g.72724 Transcript_21125/m.72724 type:complete len:214 (-) Transcript_21125:240-881(-)
MGMLVSSSASPRARPFGNPSSADHGPSTPTPGAGVAPTAPAPPAQAAVRPWAEIQEASRREATPYPCPEACQDVHPNQAAQRAAEGRLPDGRGNSLGTLPRRRHRGRADAPAAGPERRNRWRRRASAARLWQGGPPTARSAAFSPRAWPAAPRVASAARPPPCRRPGSRARRASAVAAAPPPKEEAAAHPPSQAAAPWARACQAGAGSRKGHP